MSASDAERGRDEPIDAEWEPADRRHRRRATSDGVGMGAVVVSSILAAFGGAGMGAYVSRSPAFAPLLDSVAPPAAQGVISTAGGGVSRIPTATPANRFR